MLNHLIDAQNVAFTTNGAKAFASTKNNLLDFFANGGAMRNASEDDIICMFTAAFGEDPLSAMRMLFYFRDVRGGQGERRLFHVIIKYLADYHTDIMRKNLHLIPEYGRWDDLYVFFGTRLEKDMLELIRKQLYRDLEQLNE